MTETMGHVRCLGCGKVLGRMHDRYYNKIAQGIHPGQAMTELGLTRQCCRMWMLSPFSVPIKSSTPDVIGVEEDLTIATGPSQISGSLQIMQNSTQYSGIEPQQINQPSTQQIIQPEETGGIGLMPIPVVSVPSLDQPKTKPKSTVRVYSAW